MTVIPDKHTFTIWQGATFFEALTLYETSDRTLPRDLSGYSAEMIIRTKPQGSALLTLSTNNATTSPGCSITLGSTSEEQGVIKLLISASATAAINWKSASYDLTITDSGGITDALLYGGIKVVGV
jgi:hypothetical protein